MKYLLKIRPDERPSSTDVMNYTVIKMYGLSQY